MNDMVSIRKIRPLASAEARDNAGAGAALTGGDFFLGGNQPSLAARRILTTGYTEEHRGKQPEVNSAGHREFPRAPPCTPWLKLFGLEISKRVLGTTSRHCVNAAFRV